MEISKGSSAALDLSKIRWILITTNEQGKTIVEVWFVDGSPNLKLELNSDDSGDIFFAPLNAEAVKHFTEKVHCK